MDVDAEASLLELSWPPDATRALVLSGAALARVRKELASADELRRLQRNRLKNVFEIGGFFLIQKILLFLKDGPILLEHIVRIYSPFFLNFTQSH